MKLRFFLLAAAMASSVSAAQAQSFFELINTSAMRTTTGATQIVGAGTDLVVAQLRLRLAPGQSAFITYTYQGAETQTLNQFFGPGASSMIDSLATPSTLITTPVAAGLLDFSFRSAGNSEVVTNSTNQSWNRGNFGVALDRSGLSGRLLFEDGGLRPDFDYDDFVVGFRVNVVPVPEASSVLMLFAGLGALAFVGRRARKK